MIDKHYAGESRGDRDKLEFHPLFSFVGSGAPSGLGGTASRAECSAGMFPDDRDATDAAERGFSPLS